MAAACLSLAACSSGLAPSSTELPAVSALPSLPSLDALAGKKVVGSPTEVYTRIARGAVTCWFGANGPLKKNHIYHADAEPQSKGGAAEIIIFQKDVSLPDPRALKAFRVGIVPTGELPRLEVENFKISEPLAERLRADVDRWGAAEDGCGETPVMQGWSAQDKSGPAAKNAKQTAKKK